jgi:hypothetical protein
MMISWTLTSAMRMNTSSKPNHLFITKRVYSRAATVNITSAMSITLTMTSAGPRVTGSW